jgi:predicted ATP-grasp superfamily ATP-dependent carboligase
VLVTDGEYKLTLGVVRSLGRRDVHVIAGGGTRRAEAFLSRYAAETVVHPSPEEDDERFVAALTEIARRRRADVVLPVGYASTRAVARHRDAFAGVACVAVADWEAMQVAGSKRATTELAQRLGVPTPRTFASADDVESFPVVVKESLGSGHVRYVNDRRELDALSGDDLVLQEYVPGEGRGFFCLMDSGVEKAMFMHRRIREFPVTGGASTAAESFYDERLRELGLTLLRDLRWHGVAMAEFKVDARDGSYKLLELNPKFWGSIDLAIAAGVDFPWLAVQLAVGEALDPVLEYPSGVRFQWVFADLLHAAARPSDLPTVIRDLVSPSVRDDVWLRDLKPNLFEALLTAAALVRRVGAGTLRTPHGQPVV